MKIRLLVADDHSLVRMGLRTAFLDTEIEVVAEAADPPTAVRLARESTVDVMLLDIGWHEDGSHQFRGFQILSDVRAAKPELSILVYSMHHGETYRQRARALGACGYVVKGALNRTIVEAVRRAHHADGVWFEYLGA